MTDTTQRRLWVFYIPYVVLAIGMGVALVLVSRAATERDLSAERSDRLSADCRSRVEGRDVLRVVINRAYEPSSDDPTVRAIVEQRRDDLLDRVPPLRCVVQAGIPIPVPVTGR